MIIDPKMGSIRAFAVIVDINHFTTMVDQWESDPLAQFIRDILSGGIDSI